MDCGTVKEWMAAAVAEGTEPGQQVSIHLSECPGCQAEFDQLRRTWVLCGTWIDTEPPTRLDRAILAEVRAETERSRAWLRRLATGRVWATAVTAAALAVVASFVLPYRDSLRLCGKLLADLGLALPALPLSFLVGLPYALVPLLIAALAWVSLKGNGRAFQGIPIGQAFGILMVPYVLFACVDLGATVIAGILLGTAAGALLGGAASQWVIRHRPRGVTA